MTVELIWLIIVSLSAPITGVVAFYLQLKNVRKANLENRKLILELHKLKLENERLDNLIHRPTYEEIDRYGRKDEPMCSLAADGDSLPKKTLLERVKEIDWLSLVASIVIVAFISYLFFDVYRLGKWIIGIF
ncbi:hypothetical protein [Marinimicrobium sp. ARAG 43.8]|uniref:hypothetical protein n=1 Tax=Marinimicrobium sp. ARAG 43.8 TaxID=3418719 RepID=UPI003CF11FBC